MDKQTDIFLSILESHKGIIYKVANSYCKEEEDRKDLIQEIIIQLWQSFDKYDSRFKWSTWIYRIALNTSISFYRKSKIRNEKTVTLNSVIKSSLEEEEQTEMDAELVILQKLIRELKEIDRALIILYLDGKSQKEISEILGITPTNISTKIARIKKTLKKQFSSLKNKNYGGQ